MDKTQKDNLVARISEVRIPVYTLKEKVQEILDQEPLHIDLLSRMSIACSVLSSLLEECESDISNSHVQYPEPGQISV